ncbi:hypothetical protein HanIR_Chr15g0769591 [Helianthus annuus]|nr:hypothetical protein HanIR_Chr15g0769591 [Helianthus annuus]
MNFRTYKLRRLMHNKICCIFFTARFFCNHYNYHIFFVREERREKNVKFYTFCYCLKKHIFCTSLISIIDYMK